MPSVVFTIPTVARIRKAVADAEVFFVSSDFDLRREFSCHDLESFVGGLEGNFPQVVVAMAQGLRESLCGAEKKPIVKREPDVVPVRHTLEVFRVQL